MNDGRVDDVFSCHASPFRVAGSVLASHQPPEVAIASPTSIAH